MPHVLKRPLAEADLDDIWWFIAQDNPEAADQLLDKIGEQCLTLAEFPKMGATRDKIMPDLRNFPVGNISFSTCRLMMALRLSGSCPGCATSTPFSNRASVARFLGVTTSLVNRMANEREENDLNGYLTSSL